MNGRGLSNNSLKFLFPKIDEVLNCKVYRGTLNIYTNRPIIIDWKYNLIRNPESRLFFNAQINGVPCILTRWNSAPLHVFEIIACVKLRDWLNLDQYDEVEITIDEHKIQKTPIFLVLLWNIYWKKREYLFYTNWYKYLVDKTLLHNYFFSSIRYFRK